ncbi:MAG: selenide, water dikinase SelD [Spirochaetaceae bacterium]|nr:selenide, water dikinase SelD [Spirochaetaceae bacterium]MDT8297538.1 selenide, water dikinase SelD [Spirochaetaceae bacterium]
MKSSFDLLSTVDQGGCSAKLPAAELHRILKDLPVLRNANLLVGNENHDDACVYRLDDETAVISTTDFFPPVCSDPYDFGQIAAANSISDIYAMGGRPISALNLAMFPSERIDIGVLKEILTGGADKAIEAGLVLAGGHTIDDFPPKYGLAVTGLVHPDRIITNSAARVGEKLILTKPLGTGIVIAGRRVGEASIETYDSALTHMKTLNRKAAEVMQQFGIRCATDVTGFSLLGHGLEMAKAGDVGLRFHSESLPRIEGAYELIDLGCIPGASFRNWRYVEGHVGVDRSVDYNLKMLMADAQTSGGILMSAPAESVDSVLSALSDAAPYAAVIGEVVSRRPEDPWIRIA